MQGVCGRSPVLDSLLELHIFAYCYYPGVSSFLSLVTVYVPRIYLLLLDHGELNVLIIVATFTLSE
jgi:hypothetical protein